MRICLASPIDAAAIDDLGARHDVVSAIGADEATLASLVRDREVLVVRSGVRITARVMDAAPDLRLLIRAGSGLDNIDLQHAERRGIRLVRIPQPGARAVAELTFALMLALSRELLAADRSMREARWAKDEREGHLLAGKTLGVVGLGSIGTTVARLGVAWGMEAIGCVERATDERARAFLDEGIELTDLASVTARADYLSVHVPLKGSTRHLIDAGVLARMKPGAYLLNLARGGVVDEDALHAALTGGRLRGAGLDVHASEGPGTRSPLADAPNVVLTPHIGAMAIDAQREIGRRVIELVDELGRRRVPAAGGRPSHSEEAFVR